MAGDSFLQRILGERQGQQRTLQNSSMPGKMNATPPVNPASGTSPEYGGGGGEPNVRTNPPNQPVNPNVPPDQVSPPIEDMLSKPIFDLSNVKVPQLEPLDEQDFYRRTGRQMSQGDKVLLDSRRSFFISRGRMPTPRELIYEAQRGMIGQREDGFRL